jgi:hypothetical protein
MEVDQALRHHAARTHALERGGVQHAVTQVELPELGGAERICHESPPHVGSHDRPVADEPAARRQWSLAALARFVDGQLGSRIGV